jgi:hypothetical protein
MLKNESKGILKRYGCLGLPGVFGRTLRLYLRSPAYRKFAKDVQETGIVPKKIDDYFGYGVFTGRK